MKKFLCMTMLMLAALTVSAGGSDEGRKPPEQDIGPPTAGEPRTENPCAPIELKQQPHRLSYPRRGC